MRIQKSVFEIEGNKSEIDSLIRDVEEMIDSSSDKIAVIPLCENDYKKVEFYGVLSKHSNILPSFYIL